MGEKNICFLVLTLVMLSVAGCKSTSPFVNPPLTGQWRVIPELTDEFEGDRLDQAKWHDHNPKWTGRRPGFFSTNNVTVNFLKVGDAGQA